jgi:hypothetical protein
MGRNGVQFLGVVIVVSSVLGLGFEVVLHLPNAILHLLFVEPLENFLFPQNFYNFLQFLTMFLLNFLKFSSTCKLATFWPERLFHYL